MYGFRYISTSGMDSIGCRTLCPAYIFQADSDKRSFLANIEYSPSRLLCIMHAVNEVADAVSVAVRENVRTLKISTGISPPAPTNITSDAPGSCPRSPEPTLNIQSTCRWDV